MQDRWLACVNQLESEVPTQLYKTWIKPLMYLGYDESDCILRLGAPNQFKLNWVRNQFGSRIGQLAERMIDPRATVVFEICVPGRAVRAAAAPAAQPLRANGAAYASSHHGQPSSGQSASQVGAQRSPQRGPQMRTDNLQGFSDTLPLEGRPIAGPMSDDRELDLPFERSDPDRGDEAGTARPPAPRRNGGIAPHTGTLAEPAPNDRTKLRHELTFENFVTGKSNQMARAAALQVVERPGTSYNPLFLYGGVGLGKTHLIHAVGSSILERNPRAKVRYIHAQEYFEEMVRAIQKKNPDEWKHAYQSLDLLLIDDIQFLSGKPRTQEEFFYTFEALFAARKQIIITCDTYPKEIAGVEERLISRFDSGLIVAIEPPELEMRVAILHKKAEASGAELPEDVAFFIAKHLRSNVRELEGALLRVVAYAGFRNRPISLDLAKEALDDLLSLNRRQISIEYIQKTVADFFKLKVADMYSKRRLAHIVLPRQIAMYLAKELTQKSLPEIGDGFGGRDHTTVLHAVRKISEQRQHDGDLNHHLHVLEQTLRG